jgi:putative DNA primase/helicase
VTAICGDPGVGKSFLCVDIAARVSRGDRFRKYRDEAPPVIGDVIYITSELLPSQILKPRLVAADADANRITVITGIYKKDGEIDMFDVDHLPLLKEHILKDQGRVKLVVIDPIASHLKKGTNILDTVDTRRVMDTIANFAETAHVASLVSFHLNKDTTKQALHRIAGSMQFIASVKSAWAVTEDSGGDENRRYFAPIKNNLATTKKSLPFLLKDTPMKDKNGNRICTARILWDSEPTFIDLGRIISPRAEGDRSQTDKAKDLLREQLKGGQRPARELFKLAEQQGISADILKRAKEQMHVKGDRLGFQGPVFWFFPDTDKEAS